MYKYLYKYIYLKTDILDSMKQKILVKILRENESRKMVQKKLFARQKHRHRTNIWKLRGKT